MYKRQLWEDPGFVLVEAALAGTSIISSKCPNGPEEILQNEKSPPFSFFRALQSVQREKIEISKKYKLSDVQQAHKDLENRIANAAYVDTTCFGVNDGAVLQFRASTQKFVTRTELDTTTGNLVLNGGNF